MTVDETREADRLLSEIETAVGQLPERSGPNATLITTIIESVNGLRTLLGVIRPH